MKSKEPYMKMLQSRFRNMFIFYGCKPIYFDTDSIKIEPCDILIGGRNAGKTYKEKQRLNAMYGSRICHQVTKKMFTVKEFKERITKSLHIRYFLQMKVSVEVIDYSLCMYNVEVQFFYKDCYNDVGTTVTSLDFRGLVDAYERLCNGIDIHLKECDEEWEQNTEP